MRILAMIPQNDSAICVDHHYSETWDVGYDRDNIIYSYRLYDIQMLPSLYLLDEEKKVIVKEADYNRLVDILRKLMDMNNWK